MHKDLSEQNELDRLHSLLEELGLTGYEIRKGNVVFWREKDLGAVQYLVSRRKEQLQDIISRAQDGSMPSL